MDKIFSFDHNLTNFLSTLVPHNIFFNDLFSFFSMKGSAILIWILVIGIVVLLEERKNPGISIRDKKFIILFSLAFLFSFIFSDLILKNIFQRHRPFLTDYRLPIQLTRPIQPISTCPTDFSFPSAHAATAFAAATVLTFFDKKRRWFYYSVAILISYSRIYLGCHYFFDVVGGGLLGYIISKFLLRLQKIKGSV